MPKWLRWSQGYPLPIDEVSLEHKGTPISGDKDCILEYFVKRGRAGAVNKGYDFRLTLNIDLLIENHFYEKVSLFQEQVYASTSILRVSKVLTVVMCFTYSSAAGSYSSKSLEHSCRAFFQGGGKSVPTLLSIGLVIITELCSTSPQKSVLPGLFLLKGCPPSKLLQWY